jgi:hypothetical protein
MSNHKRNSEDEHVNPIDAVLNQSQEGKISRPESVEEGVFDVKADDLAQRPHDTSQEHSLDDTHETLTPACLETDALDEATEDAMKRDDEN